MSITELARVTGASVDELRYMERKGFLKPARRRLRRREVRDYPDGDIRKVQLIVKYRRQEFTWDAALKKAVQDLNNPRLFEEV
jgi:DNA-binding transcriptional MerR regulator